MINYNRKYKMKLMISNNYFKQYRNNNKKYNKPIHNISLQKSNFLIKNNKMIHN